MNCWIRSFTVTLSLLLAACASNVIYDYDPATAYFEQSSFSFVENADKRAMSLDDRRIRNAIGKALESKGMRNTTGGDAAILVDYRIEEAKRLETSGISYGIGIGGSRSIFGISTAPEAREIKEGRLVVEIIDPKKNEVIWRATSRRNLTPGMDPEQRKELIDEVVQEMFSNYPPQPGR